MVVQIEDGPVSYSLQNYGIPGNEAASHLKGMGVTSVETERDRPSSSLALFARFRPTSRC